MARRKSRPSRWVIVICLGFIVAGTASHHWEELLTGVSGIIAMFFMWVAFRHVVRCDVKRKTKPGFCERQIKGALFGCNDHYWDKVLAWTRYLGAGYLARMLHITLPILRWQAGVAAPPTPSSPSEPAPRVAFASVSSSATRQEPARTQQVYSPSPAIQAISIYVALISVIATVAGLALSIIELAK
jgi:hypothetical protein